MRRIHRVSQIPLRAIPCEGSTPESLKAVSEISFDVRHAMGVLMDKELRHATVHGMPELHDDSWIEELCLDAFSSSRLGEVNRRYLAPEWLVGRAVKMRKVLLESQVGRSTVSEFMHAK